MNKRFAMRIVLKEFIKVCITKKLKNFMTRMVMILWCAKKNTIINLERRKNEKIMSFYCSSFIAFL